ncbi:MAG: hypothetical protein NVSMB26_07420 [Beijerinckiaceae bacterium]
MYIDLSRRPRTRRVFSQDDMARMRDLYYDRDVPMPQVAAAFGVPASTFLRWIAEMDWPRRSTAPPSPSPVPHPSPLLASTPLDPHALAIDVAVAARAELTAMGEAGGPMNESLSLDERQRRADIIASLSRSIARIDKTFEARTEREALKRLVERLQERLSQHENAGLIEAQKLALAALKEEFGRVRKASP